MFRAMYCVEVYRDSEEMLVRHYAFGTEPTREDILARVLEEDLNYNDDYGKLVWYKVVDNIPTKKESTD